MNDNSYKMPYEYIEETRFTSKKSQIEELLDSAINGGTSGKTIVDSEQDEKISANAQAISSEVSRSVLEDKSINERLSELELNSSIDYSSEIEGLKTSILSETSRAKTEEESIRESLSDYALRSEIPSTANLATKGDIDTLNGRFDALEIPQSTEDLSNDSGFITDSVISDMLTKTEAAKTYQVSGNYLTEHQSLEGYARTNDIPTNVSQLTNDSKYQTEKQVSDAIAKVVGSAPEALDTLEEIAAQLSGNSSAVSSITNTLSQKADKTDISDMLTKTEASQTYQVSGNYLTEHQSLEGYATVSGMNEALSGKVDNAEISDMLTKTEASEMYQPIGSYLTEHQDVSHLATKEDVNSGDSKVLTNILGRIWNNTNEVVSGYFQTKYTHANDGSYATLWNESDGGGSQYYNAADNILSYVGTNNGSKNEICVQIYSKDKTSNEGTRINVNPNGAYYSLGSSKAISADDEIATKKDIPSLSAYATTEYVDTAEESILGKVWNSNKDYFETTYTHEDGSYSKLWNESDGGGSQYYHVSDDTLSYVGTNDGGKDGITVQIYSKNKTNGIGARLNVNPSGIYYGVGSASELTMIEDNEIAVKKDIPTSASQLTNDAGYLTEHQDISNLATKDSLNELKNNVWNSTSNYFETTYKHSDGSYAKMWNESDGGGSQFKNTTKNTMTYVGVNDGNNGVYAQIYSKDITSNVGSRVNVSPQGVYYAVSSAITMTPEYELAVKGDIPTNMSQLTNDAEYTTKNELNSVNAYVDSLLGRLSLLENKVSDASKTNKEVVTEVSAEATYTDTSKDYVFNSTFSSNTNVSGNSVTLEDSTISNDARLTLYGNEVEVISSTVDGEFPKSSGNAILSVRNSDYVTFKDTTYTANVSGYNALEIGLSSSELPKSVLIENCDFNGTYSNNVISIFGTQNNAIVNINNCHFGSASNIIRLSNSSNASGVTVNITNCTVDSWETAYPYQGLLICQDYTSNSTSAETENNLFGNGKITVNITNLTGPNGKVEKPNNISEVCGSKDDKQLCYVYCNKNGFIEFNSEFYPILNIY